VTNDLKRILEGLLFAAEGPLSLAQLAKVLETEDKQALGRALGELATEYDYLERAFALVEVAGGWQLRTRPELAYWLRKLKRQAATRLSRAALETLAIIAYKQPVLKAEIERIRGVEVGGVLRMLMEKDLVKVVGRKDLPGRPLIYGTTKRFLEVFDLKDLNDLPTLEEMEAVLGEAETATVGDEQAGLFDAEEEAGDGEGPAGQAQPEAPEAAAQGEADGETPAGAEPEPEAQPWAPELEPGQAAGPRRADEPAEGGGDRPAPEPRPEQGEAGPEPGPEPGPEDDEPGPQAA
jgi:segregation and condensation protein B